MADRQEEPATEHPGDDHWHRGPTATCSICRFGMDREVWKAGFVSGREYERKQNEREARVPAPLDVEAVRTMIESYRYSEPLVTGTPEHKLWERNEETLNAMVDDLARLSNRPSTEPAQGGTE